MHLYSIITCTYVYFSGDMQVFSTSKLLIDRVDMLYLPSDVRNIASGWVRSQLDQSPTQKSTSSDALFCVGDQSSRDHTCRTFYRFYHTRLQ